MINFFQVMSILFLLVSFTDKSGENYSSSNVLKPQTAEIKSENKPNENSDNDKKLESKSSTNSNKKAKITEDEAVRIVNDLISKGIIRLEDPNCKVQYFYKNEKNFHVIRIAFIDPNNPDSTTTTARYWVSEDGTTVYEEQIFTGELTKIDTEE